MLQLWQCPHPLVKEVVSILQDELIIAKRLKIYLKVMMIIIINYYNYVQIAMMKESKLSNLQQRKINEEIKSEFVNHFSQHYQ